MPGATEYRPPGFETHLFCNSIMSNKSEYIGGQYFPSFCRFILLGCIASVLSGCAHSKCPLPVRHEVTIPKPYDVVWAAVVEEAATAGTNSADRITGSVHVEKTWLQESDLPLEQYACDPESWWAHWSDSRLILHFDVLLVSPMETRVVVVCRFYRFDSKKEHAWRVWPSTGRLEQQVLSNIRTHSSE